MHILQNSNIGIILIKKQYNMQVLVVPSRVESSSTPLYAQSHAAVMLSDAYLSAFTTRNPVKNSE